MFMGLVTSVTTSGIGPQMDSRKSECQKVRKRKLLLAKPNLIFPPPLRRSEPRYLCCYDFPDRF
jgi:hypothetical protein